MRDGAASDAPGSLKRAAPSSDGNAGDNAIKLKKHESAAGNGLGVGPDRKKREVVIEGFQKKSGLNKSIAEGLEAGMFKAACPNGEPLAEGSESFKAYKNQYKRLCTHLRQNKSLAQRLTSGDVPAEHAASMADDELMAEKHRNERDQLKQESLQEALGPVAEDSAHWTPSSDYTCPDCESTQCLYIQWFKGSHSYDDNNMEPVICVRCVDCKRLWKEDEVEGGRLAAGSFEGNAQQVMSTSAAASAKSGAPAIWGESQARKAPTWLLPASG